MTQVLTWTGGGEQLASGALDGSVLVWSVSPLDGTLTRTVAYGGLCHPYGLVAVGRWVKSHRRVMLRRSVQTGKGSSFFRASEVFLKRPIMNALLADCLVCSVGRRRLLARTCLRRLHFLFRTI